MSTSSPIKQASMFNCIASRGNVVRRKKKKKSSWPSVVCLLAEDSHTASGRVERRAEQKGNSLPQSVFGTGAPGPASGRDPRMHFREFRNDGMQPISSAIVILLRLHSPLSTGRFRRPDGSAHQARSKLVIRSTTIVYIINKVLECDEGRKSAILRSEGATRPSAANSTRTQCMTNLFLFSHLPCHCVRAAQLVQPYYTRRVMRTERLASAAREEKEVSFEDTEAGHKKRKK